MLQTEEILCKAEVTATVAEEVVAGAHERCPCLYSNATRGTIDVNLTVL